MKPGARAVLQRRHLALIAALAAMAVAGLVFAAVAGASSVKQIWDGTATPTWQVQVAGSGTAADTANGVVTTTGGVTFVTGAVGNASGDLDLSLTELVNGAKKWTKTWGGAAHGGDGGYAIAFGTKGYLYTAGWTTNTSGNTDILLIKWTTAGKRVWVRTYNGPKHRIDYTLGLAVDKAGNATVVGACNGVVSPAYGNIAVVSWSAKGTLRWARIYIGSGHGVDVPKDVLVAKDGSVYMTGWTWVSGSKWGAVTAHFSAAGKVLWSRVYLGPNNLGAVGNAIAACPSGGVYVGGGVDTTATGTDGMILRYTTAGSLHIFADDTNGTSNTTAQWFNDIAVTTGKHVIAVGEDEQLDASGDAYFEDYNSAGTAMWPAGDNIMAYGTGTQYFAKVATDSVGGYYLVGVAGSPTDIYVYRGSQNLGGGYWQSLWGNGDNDGGGHVGANTPNAVAVAGTTVWVAGTCATAASGTDQIMVGFAY